MPTLTSRRRRATNFRFNPDAARVLAGGPVRELTVIHCSTGHAYLHPRHGALAATMAATLQQMKKEGLVQLLLDQALLAAETAEP